MTPDQRLEEIRRTDNVLQAFRNLLRQFGMIDLDSSRLFQYHADLENLERRLSILIHKPHDLPQLNANAMEGPRHP